MAKGNLLLVEDEVALINLLADILSPVADNVFKAHNGLEALDVLENNTIHGIVCDINMPKMNGIELIAKMREIGLQHPIIFYTAHGNDALMREALSYGAFDFLAKPNFDNLEDTVRLALEEGLKDPKLSKTEDSDSAKEELEKMLKD